jgi:hypothetical protein
MRHEHPNEELETIVLKPKNFSSRYKKKTEGNLTII